MTYPEALKYLDSFVNFEKTGEYNYKTSLKLDRMKRLAAFLGDPQDAVHSIHIAGSKGKGSTASYAHSILRHANLKVGLYTSPHLITFRERIRIGGELISEEDLSRILEDIKGILEASMKDDRPTFFEVYTAIAYIYFKEKKVDLAVYEAGLGGRLDATNLIKPLVSAITPISYEHTDILGNTLREIAAEKCGIIKSDSICVSAPQETEALKTIKKICKDRSVRLILIGRDIKFKELESDENLNIFDVEGTLEKYPGLKTKLIGRHQIVNAVTAIGIVEALRLRNFQISSDAIRGGIEDAQWEGRLEILGRSPLVVVDGAHNRASARALADSVKRIFRSRRVKLIFGVSKDKDVNGMLEELLPIANSIIFTKSKAAGRALDPALIEEIALKVHLAARRRACVGGRASGVGEALNRALADAGKEDMILITGSLFIVGEALQLLRARPATLGGETCNDDMEMHD
ncbi:MAG: folylpolyglutamate synthase/dihydrofolate synthase family protein [Candidatus Omnitrophota bacterium]|nr:folylpolyglutamate synthase/dihydrofolate synthase family protein [Candidatus Omnitrophota bacterium]